TRSQDGYYLLMTPLWLAAAATVPAAAFATAWQPRLVGLRVPADRRRLAHAAVAAVVLAPAAVCATAAAASSPALRLVDAGVNVAGSRLAPRVTAVTVDATNTTAAALRPH